MLAIGELSRLTHLSVRTNHDADLLVPATVDPATGYRYALFELAVATHVGSHDEIEVTYGEVGTWVVSNAFGIAGGRDG